MREISVFSNTISTLTSNSNEVVIYSYSTESTTYVGTYNYRIIKKLISNIPEQY